MEPTSTDSSSAPSSRTRYLTLANQFNDQFHRPRSFSAPPKGYPLSNLTPFGTAAPPRTQPPFALLRAQTTPTAPSQELTIPKPVYKPVLKMSMKPNMPNANLIVDPDTAALSREGLLQSFAAGDSAQATGATTDAFKKAKEKYGPTGERRRRILNVVKSVLSILLLIDLIIFFASIALFDTDDMDHPRNKTYHVITFVSLYITIPLITAWVGAFTFPKEAYGEGYVREQLRLDSRGKHENHNPGSLLRRASQRSNRKRYRGRKARFDRTEHVMLTPIGEEEDDEVTTPGNAHIPRNVNLSNRRR